MAIPQIPNDIQNLRDSHRGRMDETDNARFARAEAERARDEVARSFDSGTPERDRAEADVLAAQDFLAGRESAEAAARNALTEAIQRWLEDDVSHATLSPDADYTRLKQAGAPIALFPVRLETRFDVAQRTLRVRMYPDELLAITHERALLPKENAEGRRYWEAVNPETGEESVAAWGELVGQFGIPRAAYIAEAMRFTEGGEPPMRAKSPSRPARAVLPDRWVVAAYKNGVRRHLRFGLPIPEPLELTDDPSSESPQMVDVADGFQVPSALAWTVKYETAKNQGMAIDIDQLRPDELATGFDRVIVFGVKTSMDASFTTSHMRELFYGHHYTRQLALVSQGTPTNNVSGRPTPITMATPTAAESFETERRFVEFDGRPNHDHFVLSSMLLGRSEADDAVFRFIPGAEPFNAFMELEHAARMRRALWPATLGYFMEQLMNPWRFLVGGTVPPIFDDNAETAAHEFFVNFVSAQGPAPAFRIGAVPYGVLPALSLSRWQRRGTETQNPIDTLRRLLPFWQAAAKNVPFVTPTSPDPNSALMEVLSQKASSDGVFIRNCVGTQTTINLAQYFGIAYEQFLNTIKNRHDPILGALGHRDWAGARILGFTFFPTASEYKGALVTADPRGGKLVSATEPENPLAPNYIAELVSATVDQIERQNLPSAGPDPKPLLYLLLRHSILLEVLNVGRRTAPFTAEFNALGGRVEFEHHGITLGENRGNLYDILRKQIPFSGITRPLLQHFTGGAVPGFNTFRNSVGLLKDLPVRELERLLTETLDLASQRLDAYITALATRRLSEDREQQSTQGNSFNYLGGYGWVENLRPKARGTKNVDGLGPADIQDDNGGYVHAPSLRHASTAAILRSGRLAEKATVGKYAIELPSARARRARRLIEGLRADQSLGALLGYEFERAIRDGGVASMEAFILALRKLYPLVANKSELDGAAPADRIAAPNVVDGEKLRNAAKSSGGLPFGTNGLPPGPPTPSPARDAILAAVAALDETMDALGDLVISESVFQIEAGDALTAQAVMGFLPDGGHPPEPEITRAASVGAGINHRIVLLLEGTTKPISSGWAVPNAADNDSPRGQADPFVNAWVGSLLGDAASFAARVDFNLADLAQTPRPVTLAELSIGALDFLAIAQSQAAAGQGSALDRRIKAVLLDEQPDATDLVVSYDPPPPAKKSVAEALELAKAIGTTLGGARELRAADLRRAEDTVNDAALFPIADDLQVRLSSAREDLDSVIGELQGGDARTALVRAARYLADAYPDPRASTEELALGVLAATSALVTRRNDAQSASVPVGATNAARIAATIAALRIVFGRNTLAVLPAAVPEGKDELNSSIAELGRAIDYGNDQTYDAHQSPGRFLQQSMRVRDALGPWRRLSLYLGALGHAAPVLGVAQIPFVAGEDWVGRSVPTEARSSLLLVSVTGGGAPNAELVWRGLVLDEWTELVPSKKVETGIAFHYDSQNCEAPQVILMCAHSGRDQGRWTVDELSAIINETIDLASIRPVDHDTVSLGQLVPAACLAFNPENKTVSTQFPLEAVFPPPRVIVVDE